MTPTERFWAKVERSGGPDACWPWTASTFKARGGYGKFQAGSSRETRRTVRAHRYAWELANGQELAADMFACHHCDNPICCNPAHIFAGTPADNMLDKSAKGRHHHQLRDGCKHGHKWTAENTILRRLRNGNQVRQCRTCKRESYRRAA